SAVFALQSPDQTTFYLAPGTTIEYHWEVTDAAGNTGRTAEATYFYDDDRFEWSHLEQAGVTIYYYAGDEGDARAMLDVASESITKMSALLGGTVDFPVKVWIYDSVDDMRPALPRRSETYEDSVITAGIRITTDTVLVLGEASFDTLRHELTHVVTAASGESALGTLPAWLDEGTAVYGQEDPEGFGDAIANAIDRGNVLSLRSITSSPGDASKVNLFYGQSWHIVKYLVDTYGEEKFAALFATIKGGKRIDSALEAVYGFDQDGLEDEWRAANNLPPRTTPEPTEPPAQDELTATPGTPDVSDNSSDDGTSATTVIIIAIATLALAALIAFAGLTLARRFK
ncbi:MAG TPA: peptidase MA family metallohydrolase, partial [Dehalococcoidia bacterium]|nr:peptidase MA family metallohydrolase [Dehalococcoidia bacterium]